MRTYEKTTENTAVKDVTDREEAATAAIPNSVYLNAMGATDAAPPDSPSDPDLLGKIRSRLYVRPDAASSFRTAPSQRTASSSRTAPAERTASAGQSAPGRAQEQIPGAEREADLLSSNISAAAATPEAVKAEMSSRLGADFSNINFHTGSTAAGHADSIGARAYATGKDIYFGQGGFNPQVAAHELVHTAQQGAVQAAAPVVSAPAGGIQMMPNILKKLFGRKKREPDPQGMNWRENGAYREDTRNTMYNPMYAGEDGGYMSNPLDDESYAEPETPDFTIDAQPEPEQPGAGVPQPEPEPQPGAGVPQPEPEPQPEPQQPPEQQPDPQPEPEPEPAPETEHQAGQEQENVPPVKRITDKVRDLLGIKKRGPFANSKLFQSVTRAADDVKNILNTNKGAEGKEFQKNCLNTLEKYNKLVESCDAYISAREGAKTDAGAARLGIVRQIRDMAITDMAGLRDCIVKPPASPDNATMSDIVGIASRTEYINLDEKGKDGVKRYGENASVRWGFKHKEKDVFFTRESRLGDEAENKDEIVADIPDEGKRKGYREILDAEGAVFSYWSEIADGIKNCGTPEEVRVFLARKLQGYGETKAGYIRHKFQQQFDRKDESGAPIPPPIDFSDDTACEELFDFLAGANKALGGKKIHSDLTNMMEGQTISGRNAGMSRVAELLGIGDVVAKSTNAVVTQNGQTQRGNLMEKAEGQAPLDMFNKGTMKGLDVSSGNVQRQLVNLQLLDTLCGQVDRHGGNFFVQEKTDKEGNRVATGITGIDNDMAFGRGDSTSGQLEDYLDAGSNWLPYFFKKKGSTKDGIAVGGEMSLPVVDGNVADAIIALDPSMLEIVVSDIVTSKEDRAALRTRLLRMQEALKEMKSKKPESFLYKDTDWGEKTEQQLMEATTDEEKKYKYRTRNKNYYKRLRELQGFAEQDLTIYGDEKPK